MLESNPYYVMKTGPWPYFVSSKPDTFFFFAWHFLYFKSIPNSVPFLIFKNMNGWVIDASKCPVTIFIFFVLCMCLTTTRPNVLSASAPARAQGFDAFHLSTKPCPAPCCLTPSKPWAATLEGFLKSGIKDFLPSRSLSKTLGSSLVLACGDGQTLSVPARGSGSPWLSRATSHGALDCSHLLVHFLSSLLLVPLLLLWPFWEGLLFFSRNHKPFLWVKLPWLPPHPQSRLMCMTLQGAPLTSYPCMC